jgi:hypothetical protein
MKGTELAGRPFPNPTLPDLDGKRAPILGAAGSCVVAIGHSGCGTTRLLVPYLQRMHDRRPAGTSVLVVLQDVPADARAFLSELKAGLPVLLEPEPYALSRQLGLTTVPTLFVVDPSGRVERRSEGFQRATLEDAARRIGIESPFFLPADAAPALRPG